MKGYFQRDYQFRSPGFAVFKVRLFPRGLYADSGDFERMQPEFFRSYYRLRDLTALESEKRSLGCSGRHFEEVMK